MNIKHTGRVALIALAAGWLIDLLFWKQSAGVNVPIFVILFLAGLIYLTLSEGLRPPPASWLLLAPILFFAVFISIRQEPFTLFISWLLMLACILILAMSWLGGVWLKFALADYIVQFFNLIGHTIGLPFQKLLDKGSTQTGEGETSAPSLGRQRWSRYGLPIFIGLLIAAPVVAILGGLLSQADPIFKAQLAALLDLFAIPNFGEFVWRAFYVVFSAFVFSGILLSALLRSQDTKLIGVDKPLVPQFINWITSAVVILSVNLLFALFVYVQFRYFFGGQANIVKDGFTYSEYAVKGFNEMVTVAFLSLLLFFSLSTFTRRSEGAARRLYTILGILLVVLDGVILVSAFQRLGLYEAAYGFSRLRTQSHIFMIWLGVLLAATVFLEITNRLRGFALASLLVALGFGVTLNLINMDGFIARQNIIRASQGEMLLSAPLMDGLIVGRNPAPNRGDQFDVSYLTSLSTDAVPDLYQAYVNAKPGQSLRAQIGGALACRTKDEVRVPPSGDWRSFHFSRYSAHSIYESIKTDLGLTDAFFYRGEPLVIDGQPIDCSKVSYSFNDD